MMTKLEQAARQALEALESCNVGNWSMAFDEFAVVEAITALREALAEQACPNGCDTSNGRCVDCPDYVAKQAEQRSDSERMEPVAWFVQYQNRHEFVFGSKPDFIVDGVVEPLYAAPVRTKDLTDEEIADIVYEMNGNEPTAPFWRDLARAVLAAYKKKNRGD